MKKNNDIRAIETLSETTGVDQEVILDIINNQKKHIYYKSIKKGDKKRIIVSPGYEYKNLLKVIDKKILKKLDLPSAIKGGRKKESIYSNAKLHCEKEEVMSLDIKNFFPSINSKRVHRELVNRGFSENYATLIVNLTTCNGKLPQGFPTSNNIANMVITPMIERLQSLADKFGLTVTVWVDDITISGSHRVSKFKNLINKIIVQEAFTVNEKKAIKIMKKTDSQLVTKINVNSCKPRVQKGYVDNVRASIHKCSNNSFLLEKNKKSLQGKISFVKSINKEQGAKLKKQFDSLF